MSDYAFRINAEITNFEQALANGGVTHSIPSMFTWWASTYLSPRLVNVFGCADIPEIFASEIARRAAELGGEVVVLSLGSGDCEFERSVHELLPSEVRARWTCTDLNPVVTQHAGRVLRKHGHGDAFSFQTLDLNLEFVQGKYDVVMINHALHHFLNLEFIFEGIRRCLKPGGRILVSDMVGRNGHMRWPEALGVVQSLWASLPDEYRFNNHAKCIEGLAFNNYDCTSNGDFEGVRAQDILPLLLRSFNFEKFVGFGNIPDVFLDRAYGPNFTPARDFDLRFIRLCEDLNNHLIDGGYIKPTMMIGVLTLEPPVSETFDRWSADFSMRDPDRG
ncbi:MAG: class I SAM-dependent methyltransferase [Proteobacteria bacterium]|nr:class I SAM-dependent methyltransferase [Pseudomonadota bacterium]